MAGTTASVCIIRKDRIFVANVGDSTVVLGSRSQTHPATVEALVLTKDHHPTNREERERIQATGGGIIVTRRGTTRVLWHRANGKSVPMVNLSRSLGDLWSYDAWHNKYHVSPIPDVHEYVIRRERDIFTIIASDGLWNVLHPQQVVDFVNSYRRNELENGMEESEFECSNVAEALLEKALHEWCRRGAAADNITIMIVFFFKIEEPPTATRSSKKPHCYYRPSAVTLLETTKLCTKRVTIIPKDIQLARRISGEVF